MAEELTLKLTVDAVNAAQSIKELKQIIRDASNEALKFREGSVEFTKFSDVAAQAANKLKNVREQMLLLDPDAKIRAFTQLGNAIVGGFTAAQGAAALFGANVEDVQKALLKVQGAMALLQGFQAIQDGIKSFKLMQATILQTVSSLGAMRVALLTTGIGAIVLAIGTLAANWEKFKEAIELSFPSFGKVTTFFSKIGEVAFGTLAAMVAGFKKVGAVIDDVIHFRFGLAIKDAKEFPKALGDAYDKAVEIYKRPDLPEAIDKAITKPTKAARDPIKLAKEDIDWLFGNAIATQIEYTDQAQEIRMRDTSNAAAEFKKRIDNEKISLGDQLSIAEKRVELEKNVFAAVTQLGNLGIKNQQKLEQFQKKAAAVNIIIAQAESLANAVKAVKVAVTPIDYAIQIAAAATSVFAIFAQIKSIFSKAGASGGGPSLDTGGFSAPSSSSFSNVPSGVNFLNQPSTNLNGGGNNNNVPPPVPIVIQNVISESDITSVQKKVNTIETQATFG